MSDANVFESPEIVKHRFSKEEIRNIEQNLWVKNLWPLVYLILDEKQGEAYVGESTNAAMRMENHLSNPERSKLTDLYLITSDKFNKSATLDIESNLIKYLSADGKFRLQNGNMGLAHHNYYQKDEYFKLFSDIWLRLQEKYVALQHLKDIDKSDLFRYSPYKSLSSDQYNSLLSIISNLVAEPARPIFVEGSAGTGKTILAVFLIKLLRTNNANLFDRENLENHYELNLINSLKRKYPNPKVALVVPMVSLRNTLKNVFRNIKGLSADMVIGPSEVFYDKYDILIVDEAHRLRRRSNITNYRDFDNKNRLLNLGNEGTELDWVLQKGDRQILFYDHRQSVKPSDIVKDQFDSLLKSSVSLQLHSQFRVKGGTDYITYIQKLLDTSLTSKEPVYKDDKYDFRLFDSLRDLKAELDSKEKEFGLCRLVAGYSWEWKSKKADVPDIIIEDLGLKWNSEYNQWINSDNAANEVGCIHTTQGYDLNYAGVIFGKEISYDPKAKRIVMIPKNYHDRKGKAGIKDEAKLHEYIINIYKTLMFRGIRGTFVYVCDDKLRAYFKKYIPVASKRLPFTIVSSEVERPANTIPLYDIRAAAGTFSELQNSSSTQWVQLPDGNVAKQGSFICQVIGESMNQQIPNGSWCLFEPDEGGSREGKIVLVEHYDIQDPDFGAGITIKEYHSKKKIGAEGWKHTEIILKPKSDSADYPDIVLKEDTVAQLKVIGIFKKVLE
ncbi:MAG: DNA/RNA helicase domain-containing protein [Chitinophagaceae bacterium]